MATKHRLIPVLAIILLYVLACALPVIQLPDFGGSDAPVLGYDVLVHGWSSIAWFQWLANFPFVFGIVGLLKGHKTTAYLSGIVALVVGLTTFWIVREDPTVLRPGFFLWLGSFVALSIAGFAH